LVTLVVRLLPLTAEFSITAFYPQRKYFPSDSNTVVLNLASLIEFKLHHYA
jgi:hypothetical protein